MNRDFMLGDLGKLIEQADRGVFTPTGRKPYKNSIDMTGRVFGKLTVVRRLPNDGAATRWLCQCSCGEFMAAQGGNLRSGGTRSCGCVRRKRGPESLSWKGCGELPGRYWAIARSNASKRGIEFSVTIQDGWDIYQRQGGKCALTGWDLVLNAPVLTDVTASMDRIDSKVGYIYDNVQWVHKDVNTFKSAYSQEYFIRMCMAVAANVAGTKLLVMV
jgi:hypothetical protein